MYKFAITIQNAQIPGTVNNFPYYFSELCTTIPSGFWTHVLDQTNGLDIRFYDTDSVTELKREIVLFTGSGTVEAWVSIPTVSFGSDKVIYCVYGGVLVANSTVVWSNLNAAAVYHLQNNSRDSSVNANNGTDYAISKGTGMLHDAYVYSGSSAYTAIPNSSSLNLSTGYTLSCWVMLTSVGRDHMLVAKDSDTRGRAYTFYINTSNQASFFINGGGGGKSVIGGTLSVYTMYHLVGVHTGTSMKLYINGTLINTLVTAPSTDASTATLQIGAMEYSSFRGFAQAYIDEVRVLATAYTDDQVLLDYRSQSNPSSFAVCGGETDISGSDARYSGKFQIKINKTYIQGTLTNFPYLFTESATGIPASFWDATVPSSSYSIRFYDSDRITLLKTDISFFDPTNKKIQAWIQLPTVSSSADKYIWCTYGGEPVVNSTAVWDDIGCVLTCHLESDMKDSAGTYSGTLLGSSGFNFNSGKIGGGAELDPYFKPDMRIASFLPLGTQFIYSFWFKTTKSGGTINWLVSRADSGGTYQASIAFDTSSYSAINKMFFLIASNGVGVITTTNVVNDGIWHHIVAKRDGNNMILYVDGEVSGTPTTGPTTAVYDSYGFTVGHYPGFTAYSTCRIDEFRIYVGPGVANIGADWVKTEYQTQSGAYLNSSCSPATQSGGKIKPFMIG